MLQYYIVRAMKSLSLAAGLLYFLQYARAQCTTYTEPVPGAASCTTPDTHLSGGCVSLNSKGQSQSCHSVMGFLAEWDNSSCGENVLYPKDLLTSSLPVA
jgi:hypothetical protein